MITSIVSYDGNSFAPDYEVGFVTGSEPRLPGTSVKTLERIGAWPVIVALRRKPQKLALLIRIVGSDRDTLRTQTFQWFDPEDETPRTLVGENHAGIQMSVDALCEELRIYGDQRHDTVFVVTMVVDGDVRWRASEETSDEWNITASGQTNTINNTGEDDAYPTLEIKPTSSKSGGYDYKRYCLVTWRAINDGSNYPVRLGPLDTATLVSGGKMQADGDDLRVFVDGTEVARHLVAMNDANTYIWFSANWKPAPALELTASIAGSGTVDSIELDDADEMDKLDASGFVRVGSEVLSYSTKDVTNKRLTGIERAVWGTSAAAHSAGDAVYWMQHEVVIVYGNASATAPNIADTEPVFELDLSSNTEWVFEEFGETASRPASWQQWGNLTLSGRGGTYSASQRTLASPYTVAGAWLSELHGNAYGWSLHNPCGIVNAAWADGYKRAQVKEDFLVHLMYLLRDDAYWTWQATLTDPSADDAWESWSEAAAASDWDPASELAIAAYFYAQDVEVGTVTISLNSTETPVASIGSESGNYTLSATITNETTGEAMAISFEMTVNETLRIITDPENLAVMYLADNSNQFQAVTPSVARRLRLVPGNNVLRFDDTGTVAVTLTTVFRRRYY